MSAPWFAEDFATGAGLSADERLDMRAKALLDEAVAIDTQQQTGLDIEQDFDLIRMYEQRPVTDFSTNSGLFLQSAAPVLTVAGPVQISPWNVLRAVVNTAHAMLARSKVRGRFLTTNGTQDQKRRAKSATQWLDGWSAEAKLHAHAGAALRDGEVCRFGCLTYEEMDYKVVLGRVLPGEIRFDHVSARNGTPKTIHRQRPISKSLLLSKFGKGKPTIRDAILAADVIQTDTGGNTDLVLCREAYSVPTTKDSEDGWHGIALQSQGGARLLMEPWTKTWHPYTFFVWEAFMIGFGGVSLAAYLEPMQTELNHMQWVKRKARKLMGRPHVGLPRGSKIIAEQLTNDIASAIEFTDKPPVPLVWPYLTPQFFQDEKNIISNMYNFAGISQNASEGEKAPGAESGVAQREAMESQNLRLQRQTQVSWEDPHVEIFNRVVEMAADIVKDGHPYEVEAETREGVEVLDFAKVINDLKRKKVTIYPTGFLPLTPAARLDFILKMLESQLWDVDRARAAMSDLDVDSEDTLENSIQRMFSTAFETMLYDGKPEHPDELAVANYDLALKTATVYLAMAKVEKIKPRNVSLARRYIDELKELKKRAGGGPGTPPQPGQQQPAPQQGAPAAMPPGNDALQAIQQGQVPPPMPS